MDLMQGEYLFGSATELEEEMIKVKFSNGNAMFTKERYIAYQEKIESANKFYQERAEMEKTTPCKDKRFLQILYTIYNREFYNIATGLSQNIRPFRELSITNEAYNKANLIARRMFKINGDNEIYLHLTNSKNKKEQEDFTSRDVYIPNEQTVTPVTCALKSPQGKIRDYQEIMQNEEYVSGWAHSHARMQTFHSGTDKNNLLTEVLNGTDLKIAPNPFDTQKVKEYSFRFFPSLVFNSLGHIPSRAIAIDYPQFVLGKGLTMKTYINFSPKLRIKSEENNINLNISDIDNQIKSRVLLCSSKTSYNSNPNQNPNLERKSLEPSKPLESFKFFKRLSLLERQYSKLFEKLTSIWDENRILKKKVEGLETILMEAMDE